MYYTYILKSSKDNKLYTGYTRQLQKRLKAHNSNEVGSTKHRGPFQVIYYEACIHKDDAIQREKYLKSGMGKRYLRNRLRRFLSLTGFTLVEVCICIVIVSLGFLFLARALNSIVKAIEIADNYNYALNIYQEQWTKAILLPEQSTETSLSQTESDRFGYAVQRTEENPTLSRVEIAVNWQARGIAYDLKGFFYEKAFNPL